MVSDTENAYSEIQWIQFIAFYWILCYIYDAFILLIL